MKGIRIILIIWLKATICHGQDSVNFYLYKNYNINGVIFNANYAPQFQIKYLASRFSPDLSAIKRCESYLVLNRKDVKYVDLNNFYLADNLKDKLKNFKRQYIAYIDANKDSVIIVQLLNFKNKKKAKARFAGWEHEFIVSFDGFYEDNTVRFSVNLSKKLVSVY